MYSVHNDLKKLSLKTFLSIYFRSFFLQGSFSAKYRQNLGFAFCMEPVGKELWNDTEDRNKFLMRHTEYFNGNPFMITLVLGAVAKMEERLRYQDGVTEDDIHRFKRVVGPATGSAGDRLFWSNLRPFGIVLGLLFAVFYGIWGIFIFLAVFNIPMLILKWHWLNAGYQLEQKVVLEIKNHKLESADRIMEILGSALVTFLSVVYLTTPDYSLYWVLLSTVGLFIFSFIMLKHHLSLHIMFLLALAVAVVLGFAINVVIQ